jgi:hypothetical protein
MSTSKSVVGSEPSTPPDVVDLAHGRRLTVDATGGDQVVEIRGASGAVELRLKITEEGPVLLVEAVRIALKAADAVDVDCTRFRVSASQSIELASQGPVQVTGGADVGVNATGEVHVKGEMIYLN